MNDPDVDLMLAFSRGREEAIVELYRRYRDRIVAFCRRIVGSDAQAEEAAQEVFLKLYRARDGYEARSRFTTFLYRIAANHCLNMQARVEHKFVQRGQITARRAGGAERPGKVPERLELCGASFEASLREAPQDEEPSSIPSTRYPQGEERPTGRVSKHALR